MTEVSIQPVSIQTQDDWTLKGDLICGPDPKIAVMISSGTGFPRHFYHEVGRYLANKGAVVLTYDYRGIGESEGRGLARSGIDYPDWGRFDMVATLDHLERSAPGLRLTHLAHSVGGHFLGLMSNQDKIDRHAFASVGTGYFGGHHRSYWPLEMYFWWGIGSFSLWRHGYVKSGGGWQGEDLPPKLFKTWRRWSHRKDYLRSDFSDLLAPHHYDAVTAPIHSWIFEDDPIATKKSGRDLLDCYPNAPQEIVFRSPADVGVKRIGHEGAFRKGREALWSEWWDWLSADAQALPQETDQSKYATS